MIKGIIFDYGGTLDTGGRHWSGVIWDGYTASDIPVKKSDFLDSYVYAERVLEAENHIIPEDNFRALLEKKISIQINTLQDKGCIPQSAPKTDYISSVALYCYRVARGKVEENKPLLEELHKYYKMALVTNFYGNIRTVIEDYGIAHCFNSVIESAVVGVRKPSKEIFSLGVHQLGLLPEEVLVVGDSYKNDIEPSLAIGCNAVWLKVESWKNREDNIYYKRTINSLVELLNIVDRG